MHLTSFIQKGFSLVELMVAMLIGLILTLGIGAMFTMSSTNVTTTTQFGQLQENGRIALAILEWDLSQLAFMGDMTGTDFILGANTTVSVPVLSSDCIGAGVNNASLPNNQPAHFRKLWGFEQGVGGQSLSCLNNGKTNTDVIQLKRLIGPSLESRDPVASPSDTSKIYALTTSNQSIFFQGSTSPPTLPNGRTWEYQHHVYYIAESAAKVPELKRKTLTAAGMSNDEQLVEGIENMRILYGFDNDGDNTADSYMPAQNVTSLMWDNELFQRLVSLRVFLLVRAIEADKTYTNETSYTLGDKTVAAPKDNFRRKVVSSTIVLENPVLIRN